MRIQVMNEGLWIQCIETSYLKIRRALPQILIMFV